eukprot:TRINITY_DN3796_c0_g7_i1.p2 TRINITY_DN3796_c0_g7~~TRINITY_DN3796_c0_g7_i1.p2  ORF type:complete len:145 (+),score=39.16 TRINITY_DN3796_c0_g7_i1:133-567(+)
MIIDNRFGKKSEGFTKKFPFVAPPAEVKIDIVGMKFSRGPGALIKFCPLCDMPMIIRIYMLPCEHLTCYSCAQPESKICYVCEKPIIKRQRIPENNSVFECDQPECYKFFMNYNKLQEHQATDHPVSGNIYYKTGGFGTGIKGI